MNASRVRTAALALPEAVEQDHHGFPSFRVGGKIFATLPDPGRLHVMLGPEESGAALAADPQACEELWWGKKLSGVRVHLADAEAGFVRDLLRQAWELRAPKRLR